MVSLPVLKVDFVNKILYSPGAKSASVSFILLLLTSPQFSNDIRRSVDEGMNGANAAYPQLERSCGSATPRHGHTLPLTLQKVTV